MSTAEPRIPGVDGLRAVACLMVFGVHFAQATKLQGEWGPFDLGRWLLNGNTGVALFFVLSGFLLSLPFWQARQSGLPPPATGRYALRRAARILPAYLGCLTALVLLNGHWREPDAGLDILLHAVMLFNFREASTLSINPTFWTLAVEVQFYVLLPLLFLLLRRSSRNTAMAALLLLGGAAYATQLLRTGGSTVSASATYSLLAHLPHFLLGMGTGALFASRLADNAKKSGGRSLLLLAVVAALVAILSTPLDEVLSVPAGRYNLPFVPLLLCLLVVLVPTTRVGRALFDSAPLRGLGAVSYGIYIYHLPVLNVTGRLMARESLAVSEHWLLFGAVGLAVTLVVATLSYLLVERPVLRAVHPRRPAAPAPRQTSTSTQAG